uniref:Uncharacterized protein n=1 Tax=Anguilla anguilla TaxID=7936 RepID=A0A0E9RMH5_ANGAN
MYSKVALRIVFFLLDWKVLRL